MNQDQSVEQEDVEHTRKNYQLTPKDQRGILWLFLICASASLFFLSKKIEDPWWSDVSQNLGAGIVGAIVTYFAFDIFLFRKQREEYKQNVYPLTARLDMLAAREALPLRVYARISLWLYQYASKNIIDETIFHSLLEKARDEAYEATIKLTRFSAPIAGALSEEQLKGYATLIDRSYELWSLLNRLATQTQPPLRGDDFSNQVASVDKFRRENFEEACEAVRNKNSDDLGYVEFDCLLEAIGQAPLKKDSLNLMHYTLSFSAIESLPDEDVRKCKDAIGCVHQKLHNESLPWRW